MALFMLIGAVFSIVGLFTPFFASTTELLGKSTTETLYQPSEPEEFEELNEALKKFDEEND